MMTPQELIDLPGYGSAKRHLIQSGLWLHTIDDEERLDWMEARAVTVAHPETDTIVINDVVGDWTGEGLRGFIDNAALMEYMED